MISKNSGDVAGVSKITYTLLWQSFNTNKFKKNIYHLLLHSTTFQGCFKIGRAAPQLHKNYETFYRSNSRWPATSPSILKKTGLRYSAAKIHLGQSEVPLQRQGGQILENHRKSWKVMGNEKRTWKTWKNNCFSCKSWKIMEKS